MEKGRGARGRGVRGGRKVPAVCCRTCARGASATDGLSPGRCRGLAEGFTLRTPVPRLPACCRLRRAPTGSLTAGLPHHPSGIHFFLSVFFLSFFFSFLSLVLVGVSVKSGTFQRGPRVAVETFLGVVMCLVDWHQRR